MQYIVGGAFRGRRLVSLPAGTAIRPTTGRLRETIFNVLVHRFQNNMNWTLSGARVADAFAGTGAMGFEALSRGAAHVTFIDHATAAQSVIRANRHALGVEARSTILVQDVLQPPAAIHACTLIFLDSPYNDNDSMTAAALAALRAVGWLAHGALCVIEHLASRKIELPAGFRLANTRSYGKANVLFLWALD
ncbi:16S rRNA (guanine(966)-N(2))-methyltransferase |uniref:16S rRNA (Guanine(966)-N(2))-methyltransferase \